MDCRRETSHPRSTRLRIRPKGPAVLSARSRTLVEGPWRIDPTPTPGPIRSLVGLESTSWTIARSGLHTVLAPRVAQYLNRDLAETLIRVRLRIVGHRVGVPQIFADILKRFHLLLPRLGKIGFAARTPGNT